MKILPAVALCILLAGCGNKGSLYLSDEPMPEHANPATPADPADDEVMDESDL